MQIPSMDIRELKAGDALRADEVAITTEQRDRIVEVRMQQLRDRAAELAARPGNTKAAKRRRARR
jgi:hypothetical protein